MKNIAIIFSILLTGAFANATPGESENNFGRNYDGNSYIFVEGDVEFSVFADGQFDFVYVGPQKASEVTFISPNGNVSYNSGYNYDAYVQYDSYGAVIQIENVAVYYDEYGRINRAGNVEIRYNDRRIVRVGGLRVNYNNYGQFSHCSGAINVFNPYYVYHPWHMYYARPIYTHVIVYDYPYRRYYHPVRYSYYDHVHYYNNRGAIAYNNGRRDFYRPGSQTHYQDGRVGRNNNYDPKRVNTMVANTGRNETPIRNAVPNETSSIRSNNLSTRTQPEVRTSAPIRESVPSGNNSVFSSQTTRENPSLQTPYIKNGMNQNPTVRANNLSAGSSINNSPVRSNSLTSGGSINNNPVRSNNTKLDRNQISSQSTETYAVPPKIRTGSNVPNRVQTPRMDNTNKSSARSENSSGRNSSTVNTSRGTSTNRSNSSRTRG